MGQVMIIVQLIKAVGMFVVDLVGSVHHGII